MVEATFSTVKEILSGVACVVAFETAADCLFICNPAFERPAYYVYSTKELGINNVECTILESFDGLNVEEHSGVLYTTVEQTIFDLLRYDRDDQVILESIADWYYSHDESFSGLEVPEDIKDVFESYVEDAINYYSY